MVTVRHHFFLDLTEQFSRDKALRYHCCLARYRSLKGTLFAYEYHLSKPFKSERDINPSFNLQKDQLHPNLQTYQQREKVCVATSLSISSETVFIILVS
jgi:hypothetical protein